MWFDAVYICMNIHKQLVSQTKYTNLFWSTGGRAMRGKCKNDNHDGNNDVNDDDFKDDGDDEDDDDDGNDDHDHDHDHDDHENHDDHNHDIHKTPESPILFPQGSLPSNQSFQP